MSRWFRHYAGMMRDDKMVRVALRTKQPIERVLWVWGAILESAAEINDGGRYDLDPAEVAYFLRCDESDVTGVTLALQESGRVRDGVVTKWGDRQFQSDNAADRQRRHRKKSSKNNKVDDNVTSRDKVVTVTAMSRDSDGPETETETETETEKKERKGAASPPRAFGPTSSLPKKHFAASPPKEFAFEKPPAEPEPAVKTELEKPPPPKRNLRAELHDWAKELLRNFYSGGLINKVIASQGDPHSPKTLAKARAKIQLAATMDNPRAWLGAVVRERGGSYAETDDAW